MKFKRYTLKMIYIRRNIYMQQYRKYAHKETIA